ncbi:MAG TPA: acetyl-CoA carboxylase biotin carboxyl carrier protein subunit [Noviherbaspirillum sp.]|jgi:acetyl-CoA carboxylase biotin carboxyl carrier protein|uniref:acetyl-CoA carboxylase biotin carboxyl carrier protein subunit n=1 Tax=Noviherbaspirillum sp. TaxID=1926288 RepID=UPI002DDCC372|nr:acetyl-CoA carboxylase biotin carboxyl carrier protein subunit [Noviherbaspirillum sp.]HEV2610285.1 acetyl-CoA carboxylase biotin carboxyl carrier protein subunit [Noviherbaspirillum sp.]
MPTVQIEAEVSGIVCKVVASAGQAVAFDDTIVVIESMKMEIPVGAPSGGQLVAVTVAEGDTVTEGQVIATLET